MLLDYQAFQFLFQSFLRPNGFPVLEFLSFSFSLLLYLSPEANKLVKFFVLLAFNKYFILLLTAVYLHF